MKKIIKIVSSSILTSVLLLSGLSVVNTPHVYANQECEVVIFSDAHSFQEWSKESIEKVPIGKNIPSSLHVRRSFPPVSTVRATFTAYRAPSTDKFSNLIVTLAFL